MENQNSVVEQFEAALQAMKLNIEKNDSFDSLNEANDFYNRLLDEGVIKKRGYTLRGIEDSHLFNIDWNSSFK